MQTSRLARRLAVAAVIGLLLGPLSLSVVLSAVTISGFHVEAGEQEIFVYWETASEIGNLGFYVWRSEQPDSGYVKLPVDAPSEQFIPSEDFGVGAFYEFMDTDVISGVLYYYKVQDIPANGSPGEMVGPESAGIGLTPEPTTPPPTTPPPTTRPADTPTATAQPNPAADTPTPEPNVRFWAEDTSLSAGDCTTVQWITNNVRSVFYDGTAAAGQGARTYCPCADERHTLRVTYRDGSSEAFVVNLDVAGTCNGTSPNTSTSPLATPTLRPTRQPTETPRPTPTSAPTLPPTATRQPTATPRRRTVAPAATESVLATPETAEISGPADTGEAAMAAEGSVGSGIMPSQTPSASAAGAVVEGLQSGPAFPAGLLLVVATVAGLGLVSAGLWLWRRG